MEARIAEAERTHEIGGAVPARGVGLSLRSNFSWTLLGSAVYTGCQWAMLVVLAKVGSPVMVGRFALAFAVTAPVIMLANLQLRAVQATDARRDYKFGHYLGLRIVTSVVGIVVIAGIALSSHYRSGVVLVILAVGLAKTFESVSDVIHGLAQQHERMDRIAISLIIKGVLSLGALATVTYVTGNLLWGCMALAATWAVVLLTYDLRMGAWILRTDDGSGRSLRPIWDRKRLMTLAMLSLPLGLTMMLISLNTNIPRYFIEKFAGERQLGIFAAMSYLMVAGNTVIAALAQSATPRMARYFVDGDQAGFTTLLVKLCLIGAVIGLAGLAIAAFAGHWLLTVLYKPEYARQISVFVWVAAAAGIMYVQSFLGCAMTAARRFRVQVPLLAVSAAVTAVLCPLLVWRMGLVGAGIAVTVAAAVLTVGTVIVDLRAIRGMGVG